MAHGSGLLDARMGHPMVLQVASATSTLREEMMTEDRQHAAIASGATARHILAK
jgi:hypothetical protein